MARVIGAIAASHTPTIGFAFDKNQRQDTVWGTIFEAFKRDEEASSASAGLSDEEKDLLRRRDWRGLIHYGCIFFGLEKFGAMLGISNLHIYAAMRGQSLEEFQKTRNAPGALYSVAATDAGKADFASGR